MTPTAHLTPRLTRTAARRGGAPLRLKLLAARLAAVGLLCLAAAAPARGQNVQFTQGGVGSGLENTINIPIASPPGRGAANLPLTLHYSSKLWRIGFVKIVSGNEPSLYPVFGRRATAEAIYAEHSAAGWTTSLDPPKLEWPKSGDRYKYDGTSYKGTGVESYQIQHVFVHMPDGSTHELRKTDEVISAGAPQGVGVYYAVDGSRMRYHGRADNTGTLTMPDGSRYEFQFGYDTAQFIDRNGNKLSYDGQSRVWTDTLGRPIGQPWPASPQPGVDYAYTPNGYSASYVFKWNRLSNVLTPGADGQAPALRVVGNYYLPDPNAEPTNQSGGNNYPAAQPAGTSALFTAMPEPAVEGETITYLVGRGMYGGQTFDPVVLAEVVLPNGLSYKFTYNVHGEIDKVVYPTGGHDKYAYGTVGSLGLITHPYSLANRGVHQRQQSAAGDGVVTAAWAYAGGGPYVKTTTPDGTVKESYQHNFIPSERNFGYQDARNGMTYDERVWDKDPSLAGAKMLRRTLTEWTQTAKNLSLRASTLPNPTTNYRACRNARAVRSVSFILDTGGQALAKLVTHQYDTNVGYKELTTGFDRTVMTESDFTEVDPAAAKADVANKELPTAAYPDGLFPPAGSTVTAYQDAAPYRDRFILGLVASVTMRDAAGNPVSKTETEYDQQPLIYYNDIPNDPFVDPGAARGNPTTVRRYVDMSLGSYHETRAQFDQYGNPVYNWDERATTFDETTAGVKKEYSAAYGHAYLTATTTFAPDPSGQVGSADAFTSSFSYDPQTGLATSAVDANGQETTYSYNIDETTRDPLNRLRKVSGPGGVWTKTDYNDVPGNMYVHTESSLDALRSTHAYQFFDGLGRATRSLALESGQTYVASVTRYDPMGRVSESSNPFRATITGGSDPGAAAYWATTPQPPHWTTTVYDALGRVKQVTLPDQTTVTTEYSGVYTTLTDQAGRRRRQKTDAQGRLIRVDEPDENGNLDRGPFDTPVQPSFYEYDALGNVVRISQGLKTPTSNPEDSLSYFQHRYFKYDALSRLTHEKQAEQAGEITTPQQDAPTGNSEWSRRLTYDETRDGVSHKGLLTTAEDARHVVTHFYYDRIGRAYKMTYSDGTPTLTSRYDQGRTDAPRAGEAPVTFHNKGRLTEVKTAEVTTDPAAPIPQTQQLYDYDLMGRTRRQRQVVGADTYELRYDYNLGGALVSQRYPSGRVVNYDYDDAGRLASAGGGATTYASAITYKPFGGVESMTLGNGAVYSVAYNDSRLQLSGISLKHGAETLQKYEYKYGVVNMATGEVDASKNNGQIARVESTVGAQKLWQQRYSYDSLGRLSSAGEHRGDTDQQSYFLKYAYDVYGNRHQRLAENPRDANNLPTNPFAQAWVEDESFDPETNRLKAGLVYDKAGNVTEDSRFRMRKFQYDANNRQKQSSSLTDTNAARSIYDGAGRRVATMAGASVTRVMVYDEAGDLAAEYGGAVHENGTQFVAADHQGSTRVTMRRAPDADNRLVAARQDYLPFGEELPGAVGMRAGVAGYGQAAAPRQKYAGMEQDDSTGMSHTLWRQFDSLSARWTAPDPYGGSMEPTSPQSFNRYVYVNNDPVNKVDPTGLMLSDIGIFQTDNAAVVSRLNWAMVTVLHRYMEGQTGQAQQQQRQQQRNSSFGRGGSLDGSFRSYFAGANTAAAPQETYQGGVSDECLGALAEAQTDASAVDRAYASVDMLNNVAREFGIGSRILAAIAIRESGFENIAEKKKGGKGRGIFQIDIGQNPSAAGIVFDPEKSSRWMGDFLSKNLSAFRELNRQKNYGLSEDTLMDATIRSWNGGLGGTKSVINKYGTFTNRTYLNFGTARSQKGGAQNYVTNVRDIMDYCLIR
ncbi:MAG TPA: RHS repeat-associated core domain-containing protein [Pyrinomonadaceae bacterium]